jgi:hypothetical protein
MLTDKRDRKFTPPPPRLKTFSGAGHALGGGRKSEASARRATAAAAATEGDMSVSGGADLWRQFCSRELWSRLYELVAVLFSLLWTLTTFSAGGKAADGSEGYELIVDEERPTTTLKVQLADGSRHEVGWGERESEREREREARGAWHRFCLASVASTLVSRTIARASSVVRRPLSTSITLYLM